MARADLDETVSFGEAAAIGRIEKALFGGDAELVKIGRYEVIERIGVGAFGRVYRARDPQLARTVALKVLDGHRCEGLGGKRLGGQDLGGQDLAGNDLGGKDLGGADLGGADLGGKDLGGKDLLAEARTMATIGHPNVAAIFDAGVIAESGRVFLAMELVVGQNLRAWLAQPRSVSAIVDVVRQVGLGLAAAHEAGIVHRDVKPENVLVGDDGRVRVVDFGLARPHRGAGMRARGETEGAEGGEGGEGGDGGAPVTATRTGTSIAGTPAYMAPELFDGAPASAASDQFALCACAWEALYGARPYGGATIEALRAAHARPLPEPPRRPRVPRPIVRALVRGLARDPGARFSSIEALLAELDRARSRRRVAIAALVATAAVGVVGGVAIARRAGVAMGDNAGEETCARPVAELVGVWDAQRKAELERANPQGFARVREFGDRVAGAWLDGHVAACRATHVEHTQSAALLDRRMACLRDWRRRFAAATEASVQTPGIALRALGELPPVGRCADPFELEAGPPRPTEPAIAKQLDELDDKLAMARVQFLAGEAAAALATSELVAREAAGLGYEPTKIAALLWRAEALTVLGRYDESRSVAKECFDLALGIRDHRTAAIAAAVIAFTGAFDSSRIEESLDWVKTGESLRAKLEVADDVAGKLAHAEGNVYLTAAEPARAKAPLERAIAAWRRLGRPGSENPNLGSTIAMLGVAEMNTGEIERAHAHLDESVRLAERDLGAEHPELAAGLINLGLAKAALGHYAEAAAVMDRGMTIQIASLGDEHPLVSYARLNRGQVAIALGDRARADRELEAAQAIADASYGPTHAVSVTIALASGELYGRTARGDLARARAQRVLDATSDVDDGPRALGYATLALAEAARGDKAATRAAAAAARKHLAAATQMTPSQRQIANDLVGEALLAIGDKAPAIESLRAADVETGGPPDPLRQARIRLALARATGGTVEVAPALREAIVKLAK